MNTTTIPANPAEMADYAQQLRTAAQQVLEHGVVVHRHWGENDNTKECRAAVETLAALCGYAGDA